MPKYDVNRIASMLTESPDVIKESMEGELQAEEVPLGDGVYGTVHYVYGYEMRGRHSPASRVEPADYPEPEIVSVSAEVLEATDAEGSPIRPTPMMVKMAKQYFIRRLKDQALRQASND